MTKRKDATMQVLVKFTLLQSWRITADRGRCGMTISEQVREAVDMRSMENEKEGCNNAGSWKVYIVAVLDDNCGADAA